MHYSELKDVIINFLAPDQSENRDSLKRASNIAEAIILSAEEYFYSLKDQKDIDVKYHSMNQEITITAKVSIDNRSNKERIGKPISEMNGKQVYEKDLTIRCIDLKKLEKPTGNDLSLFIK